MERAAKLIISGLVQGVFFRASVTREARKHGLSGYVRNLPNGNVEVWAQGDEMFVEKLIAWCRQGPPSARVDSVEVSWMGLKPNCQEFDIQ